MYNRKKPSATGTYALYGEKELKQKNKKTKTKKKKKKSFFIYRYRWIRVERGSVSTCPLYILYEGHSQWTTKNLQKILKTWDMRQTQREDNRRGAQAWNLLNDMWPVPRDLKMQINIIRMLLEIWKYQQL